MHLYGELSRTLEGQEFLAKRNIIFDTVSRAKMLYDQMTRLAHAVPHIQLQSPPVPVSPMNNGAAANTMPAPTSVNAASSHSVANTTMELRAALWSLGHIGATELGFTAIMNCDPAFVSWCIEGACNCLYFSIRGTFFHVLGLLGRTNAGARVLSAANWDSSLSGSNSAVAIPHRPSALFASQSAGFTPLHSTPSVYLGSGARKTSMSLNRSTSAPLISLPYQQQGQPPVALRVLVPVLPPGSVSLEMEVLNLIAKVRPLSSLQAPLYVALTMFVAFSFFGNLVTGQYLGQRMQESNRHYSPRSSRNLRQP